MNNNELLNNGGENLLSAETTVDGLAKISKEVKQSSINITRTDARFLVDMYYQTQVQRIGASNRIYSINKELDGEGRDVPLSLIWVTENLKNQEAQIGKMLDVFTKSTPVGQWCRATKGVGPVITAGLLAYFDFDKVRFYNQFWSYAGFNSGNNPWLGSEKANKFVTNLYKEFEANDKKIKDEIACMLSGQLDIEKDMTAIFKKIEKRDHVVNEFNDMCQFVIDGCTEVDGYNKTQQGCFNTLKKYKDILYTFWEKEQSLDTIVDFLSRNFYNKNIVTNKIILETCLRNKRTLAVVTNGLKNTIACKKDKPKYVNYTKDNLKSYLSKPPYNSSAKNLCWKLGESFVKVKNRGSLYGRLYEERKLYELEKNEKGEYAEWAAHCMSEKNYGKETESYKAYQQGKLPLVQIHRRSAMYAVKIFISHLYEMMYVDRYHRHMRDDKELYPIEYLGHIDYIEPEVPFDEFSYYND